MKAHTHKCNGAARKPRCKRRYRSRPLANPPDSAVEAFTVKLPRKLCKSLRAEKLRQGRRPIKVVVEVALNHFLSLPASERDRLATGGPQMEETA